MSSSRKGTDCGGLRTVEQLKARCCVDHATGCWDWLGPRESDGTPAVCFYLGDTKKRRGRRAALMLAGYVFPKGWVAVARTECKSDLCVNPKHARAVTAKEMMQQYVASGAFSSPQRLEQLQRGNSARVKTTLSQRIAIAMGTESARIAAAKYGITPARVRQIRAKPPIPIRGNSIFNLGG